ncbi:hypothetical protein LCGC14_2315490, partial [marine sediment metagenome]
MVWIRPAWWDPGGYLGSLTLNRDDSYDVEE